MEYKKIRELIDDLNYHTDLYNQGKPIITDAEWDRKYFQLVKYEQITNFYFPDSPTQSIRPTKVEGLKKKIHDHPMLSLDKTKSVDELNAFIGNKDYLAMAKMDGLTVSLTYENGRLTSAETRGNGIEGEDITHNALVVSNIPNRISFTNRMVIDGEIICTYNDFKEFEDEYQNPRNFAAGSIRLLDANECKKRKLSFIAWDLISGSSEPTLIGKLIQLYNLGFKVVPYVIWEADNRESEFSFIKGTCKELGYPIDGLVYKYNNIKEYEAAGRTEHHFRGGLAFKFYDEEYKTYLKNIEWSMGRTGQLTPVAIFDSVTIEGTEVSRANLHNISIMESILDIPFVNQEINIFKANLIIPQVSKGERPGISNLKTTKAKILEIPTVCPFCGEATIIKKENGIKNLICTNSACSGKSINRFDYFCSKKGMDIKGLSKATLEVLIDKGWLNNLTDIYHLKDHYNEWIKIEGFGEKSVDNIIEAIENSRTCELWRFISAIGIPLIGSSVAKELCKTIISYEDFKQKIKSKWDFSILPNFGANKTVTIWNYNYSDADEVEKELNIINPIVSENKQNLTNLIFCITGKVHQFKNRDELKSLIESYGGKVSSSVSKKTSYLIANEKETTAKYQNAEKYGIPIINEDEFIKKFDIS